MYGRRWILEIVYIKTAEALSTLTPKNFSTVGLRVYRIIRTEALEGEWVVLAIAEEHDRFYVGEKQAFVCPPSICHERFYHHLQPLSRANWFLCSLFGRRGALFIGRKRREQIIKLKKKKNKTVYGRIRFRISVYLWNNI